MWTLILVIPVIMFLGFEAFFSGSETAVISTNKMRIKVMADQGNNKAKLTLRLLSRPERVLGTTLVGTNISVATSTTLAAIVVASFFQSGNSANIESTINTIIMTPLILIFGEIIPKSICRARANSISLVISPLLRWSSIILYPAVTAITKISTYFALLFSKKNRQKGSSVTEELRLLARLSEKEGLIRPHQRKMIDSVFDLERQTVAGAMVPLVDVVSVEKDIGLEDFYNIVAETKFSRFPVYDDRVDNIIGIINAMDVLYASYQMESISQFIHEDVTYLPETKHITTSLQELQKSHHPMGIVVDEYGGVTGVVTIEDLVGEIVGEIRDERDQEQESFNDKTLECDGRISVDEVNERLEVEIPREGYETIAGFVIKQMDKIPKVGEEMRWKNLRIVVLQADERSISRVKFIIEEEREQNGEEAEAGDT
ncbi:DUF21 domain-containing protein [Candidatus Poribacteria bacterium]|nr:DUF21 domain-containing protein [Candidatus Poribacteria bacterium]